MDDLVVLLRNRCDFYQFISVWRGFDLQCSVCFFLLLLLIFFIKTLCAANFLIWGLCLPCVQYCEFSPDYEKCKEWMKTHSAEAYQQLIEQGWFLTVLFVHVHPCVYFPSWQSVLHLFCLPCLSQWTHSLCLCFCWLFLSFPEITPWGAVTKRNCCFLSLLFANIFHQWGPCALHHWI